jgi:hypothetical protein
MPKSSARLSRTMPTLHFSKDDRVEHFHLFGYFKEYTDKNTREYLGHQLLEEIDPDVEMGYSGFAYETLTQNLQLKSGTKDNFVEASEDDPLEVEVFYNYACGKMKR